MHRRIWYSLDHPFEIDGQLKKMRHSLNDGDRTQVQSDRSYCTAVSTIPIETIMLHAIILFSSQFSEILFFFLSMQM